MNSRKIKDEYPANAPINLNLRKVKVSSKSPPYDLHPFSLKILLGKYPALSTCISMHCKLRFYTLKRLREYLIDLENKDQMD